MYAKKKTDRIFIPNFIFTCRKLSLVRHGEHDDVLANLALLIRARPFPASYIIILVGAGACDQHPSGCSGSAGIHIILIRSHLN